MQGALLYGACDIRFEHDNTAVTQKGAEVIKVNATKDSLKNAPEWKWPTPAATATWPWM